MRSLASVSGPVLFGSAVAWVALVCVGWLFSPGGQTLILIRRLIREHPEGFNAALPLVAMKLWTIGALVVALVPVVVVVVGWVRARRTDLRAGRLTSA